MDLLEWRAYDHRRGEWHTLDFCQAPTSALLMNLFRMQPAFRVNVDPTPDEALQRLRTAIQSPELAGRAESAGACLDFKVPRDERRLWSPHLSVQLYEAEPGTELFCRFSPRPEIWTGVMMTYFGAVFVMFVAAIYGYVQWFLGESPWALLAIPAMVVVVLGLHVASIVGQQLSSDQMEVLRARLDRTVELAFGKESGENGGDNVCP